MVKQNQIRDSIFQVWYDSLGYLGGSGTGFIISINTTFYFVTASHCIDDNVQDLCITNLLYSVPKKLPFSKILKFDCKEDDRLDLFFAEIDLNKILNDVEQNDELNHYKLSDDLVRDPQISRIMRRSWSIKTKMKHIRRTPAYISKNKGILPKIKSLPDSDIHAKSLRHIIKTDYKEGDDLYFIGYPDEFQSIDYETNKVKSQVVGLECKYVKKSQNTGIHELRVIDDNVGNYKGFSGSPVFYNKDICGIIIRAGNKKAHFADFKYVFEQLNEQIV